MVSMTNGEIVTAVFNSVGLILVLLSSLHHFHCRKAGRPLLGNARTWIHALYGVFLILSTVRMFMLVYEEDIVDERLYIVLFCWTGSFITSIGFLIPDRLVRGAAKESLSLSASSLKPIVAIVTFYLLLLGGILGILFGVGVANSIAKVLIFIRCLFLVSASLEAVRLLQSWRIFANDASSDALFVYILFTFVSRLGIGIAIVLKHFSLISDETAGHVDFVMVFLAILATSRFFMKNFLKLLRNNQLLPRYQFLRFAIF